MKFTLTIDPTVTETIVTVTAREVDAEVQAIQRLASGSLDSSSSPAVERPLRRLIGTSGNDATVLEVRAILAFFTKRKRCLPTPETVIGELKPECMNSKNLYPQAISYAFHNRRLSILSRSKNLIFLSRERSVCS